MVPKTIGIIGSNGFIGSNLKQHFGDVAIQVPRPHSTIVPDRFNKKYDVLINANGNSNKRLPETAPLQDFDLSVRNTLSYLTDYSSDIYIHLSSCEVYTDDTSEDAILDVAKMSRYGLSKYLAECLVRNHCEKWIILRLNGILGPNMKKGPIYDILHQNKLWISAESCFQLIHMKYVCKFIEVLLNKGITNEVFNLTGPDSISLKEVMTIHKTVDYPDYPIINHNFNVRKANKLMTLPSSRESVGDL